MSAPLATTCTVIPALRYHDAAAAIEWLCRAFGFEKHLVVPDDHGGIAHAQLRFGHGMVMLATARPEAGGFDALVTTPGEIGGVGTWSAYVLVEDADAHCKRAREAGAEIVQEPNSPDYGGRLYSCRDPEGHVWSFGSYDPWAT